MPLLHLLFVLIVVFVWGLNFIFVKTALFEISPLLLCALRFFFSSIPACFFIKPPKDSLKLVFLYAVLMFGLQFAFIFCAMHVGMTAGMASVLMQVQVFFSMFMGVVVLHERLTLGQVLGAVAGFSGIVVVSCHFDNTITLLGLFFVLCAAFVWSLGNLVAKKITHVNLISVIAWGSMMIWPLMFVVSYWIEGWDSIVQSYQNITWHGFGALMYTVYLSTWVGYGVWNWLLARHPVGLLAPFTLLIPLVGVVGSVLVFDEPFENWKLVAGGLVVGGLCINMLVSHFSMRLSMKKANAC